MEAARELPRISEFPFSMRNIKNLYLLPPYYYTGVEALSDERKN